MVSLTSTSVKSHSSESQFISVLSASSESSAVTSPKIISSFASDLSLSETPSLSQSNTLLKWLNHSSWVVELCTKTFAVADLIVFQNVFGSCLFCSRDISTFFLCSYFLSLINDLYVLRSSVYIIRNSLAPGLVLFLINFLRACRTFVRFSLHSESNHRLFFYFPQCYCLLHAFSCSVNTVVKFF